MPDHSLADTQPWRFAVLGDLASQKVTDQGKSLFLAFDIKWQLGLDHAQRSAGVDDTVQHKGRSEPPIDEHDSFNFVYPEVPPVGWPRAQRMVKLLKVEF